MTLSVRLPISLTLSLCDYPLLFLSYNDLLVENLFFAPTAVWFKALTRGGGSLGPDYGSLSQKTRVPGKSMVKTSDELKAKILRPRPRPRPSRPRPRPLSIRP